MFLGSLSSDDSTENWKNELTRHRSTYKQLLDTLVLKSVEDGVENDLKVNNPLSSSESSVWSEFYKNKELIDVIKLDLSRTYPEVPFFQSDAVQMQLLHILFMWCKLNPEISYRQGMNEIVAPIMLLLNRESISILDESGNSDDLFSFITAIDYIEHDCFDLFQRVMKQMASFFVHGHPKSKVVTPIIAKCNAIHHNLLAELDKPLYRHLQSIDVLPQIYALRWVRLLFSREFQIDNVYILWDAVFAFSENFSLIDTICVSMIEFVRLQCMITCSFLPHPVLESDNSGALRRLLKYPPIEDVHLLVVKAISLVDPKHEAVTLLADKGNFASNAAAEIIHSTSPTLLTSVSNALVRVVKDPLGVIMGDSKIAKSLEKVAPPSEELNVESVVDYEYKSSVDEKVSICAVRLERICNALHAQFVPAVPEPVNLDVCLTALAELKQIRDVLFGRLDVGDLTAAISHAEHLNDSLEKEVFSPLSEKSEALVGKVELLFQSIVDNDTTDSLFRSSDSTHFKSKPVDSKGLKFTPHLQKIPVADIFDDPFAINVKK